MDSGLITHADKVLFAERDETKGDLAGYYLAVAEPLMRVMGGRPVLLQRFPDGASGPSFFQKRVPKNAPGWLQTTTVETPNGTTSQALVAADIDHVLWAVNLGCLGFHVWPFLAADPGHTDELRIDLDPTPGVDFTHIRQAAHELRRLLDEAGLTSYPKTTETHPVRTVQIAPTVLELLGLDPNSLQAVQMEHTQPLPGPFAPAGGCCGDCNADGMVQVNELVTAVDNALIGCSR